MRGILNYNEILVYCGRKKTTYINLKSMRNGPQEWILQPAITLPHLTLFHWWMPSELTQQDYYSSPQIANKALCHRFPVHRLCACQSLTASWGAIHGWVSRLLPHPLLFFGGSAECFNCPRAGGWIALQHAHSAANNPKLCSCRGQVFHWKHGGELKDGQTMSSRQWSS